MDKNNVKKFKVAISILVLAFVIILLLIFKTVPEVQRIFSIQEQTKTQTDALNGAEAKLQSLKAEAARKSADDAQVAKAFFKPINSGLDTEAAISDEFGEILQLLRSNKIKTRSIKYDYDPQDDNFVKNAGSRYQVCRITADMIANYSNFENFLRELYKHDHFLEISKIEVAPYQKNKRILLINLQIKLYALRDPAVPYEQAAPAADAAANPAAPANPADAAATPPSPQPAQ